LEISSSVLWYFKVNAILQAVVMLPATDSCQCIKCTIPPQGLRVRDVIIAHDETAIQTTTKNETGGGANRQRLGTARFDVLVTFRLNSAASAMSVLRLFP